MSLIIDLLTFARDDLRLITYDVAFIFLSCPIALENSPFPSEGKISTPCLREGGEPVLVSCVTWQVEYESRVICCQFSMSRLVAFWGVNS